MRVFYEMISLREQAQLQTLFLSGIALFLVFKMLTVFEGNLLGPVL